MGLLDALRPGLQAARRLGAVSNDTATGSALTLDADLNPIWPAPSGGSQPDVTDGITTIDAPALIEIAGATLTGDSTEAVFTVSSGVVQKATVTLSSAQILALADTPVQIVGPPGAGKGIFPLQLVSVLHFVTTGYTVASDVGPAIGYPQNELAAPQLALLLTAYDSNDLVSLDDMTTAGGAGVSGGYGNDASTFDNQAVVLRASGGNPTAGDCTLTVTLTYLVVSV